MKAPLSDTAVYSDFKDAFPDMANGEIRPGTKITGTADRRRDKLVREAYHDIMRQGWINVTIINLHAFPLDLNMAYLGHLTVPAKKQGSMYFRLVLDQPRLDMVDEGDAKYIPKWVHPKQLAEDLFREYRETGGLFFFEGEGEVPVDLLTEAKEAQLAWYWRQLDEGNSNWAQFRKNPRYITDRMREAAKELFRLKLLNDQPEWISVSRNESPNIPCEGCGNVLAKIAKFCPTCETIYDVDWVKTRRPDIWQRQTGGAVVAVQGATAVSTVDFDAMIKAEAAGTAPVADAQILQLNQPQRPKLNESKPGAPNNPKPRQ